MRAIAICFAITLAVAIGVAQQPAAQTVTYKSAAEVAAMIAKAKSQNDAKAQATISQTILQLAPYKASLEYRGSVGPAAIHMKEAEMFYVIDGSGTLITGGKLVGETKNGDNLTGTALDGGSKQAVAKGDFIIVPEATGHWFSEIKSTLVLMSFHVPRPVPGEK